MELLKVIDPLADPGAHGGRVEDAFDLVIPSILGFGFLGKASGNRLGLPTASREPWVELMQRLGYTRYIAQGGDWGAPITSAMARHAPDGLLGIHAQPPCHGAGGGPQGHQQRRSRASRIV